ncbi:MAG: histidine ammonia-lyase [Phaeodactylibacter sp.]|uniref:histidine ammonia-lyase n=1 Tax=Phaeodactylibacter sp. TaxID=1940289 RepID=UPI0032ED3C6E
MSPFLYGKHHLTAGLALSISRQHEAGELDRAQREKVAASAQIVRNFAKGRDAVYGINTGFGPLCSTKISPDDTAQLQHNLLMSHSVGVGSPIPQQTAKLMLILKVHALAQGFSGISLPTLDRILWHIEQDIIPVVPKQGSVGASGDLAPLSHLFLPLIGLGQVHYKGQVVPTPEMLQKEGLSPLQLQPKEGLALINGTQFIAAFGVEVTDRLQACLSQADLIGGMMIEGLLGSVAPFHPELHQMRPYKGNQHVAARIRALLKGSEILNSHSHCDRVQDPYSLRCIPQVHGASRNAWLHLRETLEIELNSVTDNPIIVNEELSISGGNFHGQPMALPLDYACLAASEVGNVSDRRCYLSLTGIDGAVPKLLMEETGTNSGFMILQYTAAALASENKSLCFPASADSISTSLGQEDHVSMGSISGRKALQVVGNLERILGIELVCAAQAFDFRRPLKSSPLMENLHARVREEIAFADKDRVFATDLDKGAELVRERALIEVVKQSSQDIGTEFDSAFEHC